MFGFLKRQVSKKELNKSVDDFKKIWEMDLNSIWEISDKNQFLIALNGWLCRKCNYGDDIERLSNEEKIIYVNNLLEAEVNNGGFSQFLYNSSGNFANDVIPSLLAIGAMKTAEICQEAFAALGQSIPNNTEEREELLDGIMTGEIEKMLSKYDADFYEYPDPLEELNYQFILRHKEQYS